MHYRQNTGMLIMRQSAEFAARVCRPCSSRMFWRMTLHTFFLGWWGMISMILTPIFLVNNVYYFVRTLALKRAADATAASLEHEREYALALLATKDEATVVEVISRSSGASPEEVRAFVRSLPRTTP